MNEIIPRFETLEDAVGYGMMLREKTDGLQWIWGDFAVSVEKFLGPVLDDVSKQIGVDVKTMKRYRDVAKKYPVNIREKHPKLSWTHYKHAAGQPEPEKWLTQADDNNWSVELMVMQIKTNGQLPALENKPRMVQCMQCTGWYLIGDKLCVQRGNH